jgi:hypothetical protein
VSNFHHHIEQLQKLGFALERGMLVGDGHFADARQIGTRFSTATTQIDTYTQAAFFAADKGHPVLGESQEFAGPDGTYTVTQLLMP